MMEDMVCHLCSRLILSTGPITLTTVVVVSKEAEWGLIEVDEALKAAVDRNMEKMILEV